MVLFAHRVLAEPEVQEYSVSFDEMEQPPGLDWLDRHLSDWDPGG